jgi:hypothetical protein
MTQPNKNSDPQTRPAPTETAPGDPETAGETTAADTIHGPTDTTPVGADTTAKVTLTPDDKGNDNG